MTKTILITGASTGIGRSTAELFLDKGWNVVATMRNPDKAGALADNPNVLVARLDVTDEWTIEASVAQAIEKFGQIDVLLNNAGYGAYGPLEATSIEKIRRQFDTNVIGLLAVTKAILPHFRERRSGTIINVSSIGGQITFPLGTHYHGTKFAVEGLSESLHFELEPFGVKIKIIEPGVIQTDFAGRSFDFSNDETLGEYQETVQKLFAALGEAGNNGSKPSLVADVIWQAATDGTDTLRYRAGADAEEYLDNREKFGDAAFIRALKGQLGL